MWKQPGVRKLWSSSCLCQDKMSPGLSFPALVRTTKSVMSYSRTVQRGCIPGRARKGEAPMNTSRKMGEGEDCQSLQPRSQRPPPDATGLGRALQWQDEKAGAKTYGASASVLKMEPQGSWLQTKGRVGGSFPAAHQGSLDHQGWKRP